MIEDEMGRQRGSEDTFRAVTILILFIIAIALVSFGESFYSTFMGGFLKECGIPVAEIGVFFSAFSVAALFAIPAGYVSDRLGRNIIVVFLFAMAVVGFSYTLANTRGELLLLRAAHGAVATSIFLIARAYIMDKTTKKNRGRIMGVFALLIGTFALLISVMTSTFGGSLRDQTGSFDPLFYKAAIFPLIAAILLLITVRDMRKFTIQRTMQPHRKLFSNRSFITILVMFAVLRFASSILTPIMPIFAVQELGMSYTQLGSLFLYVGILHAVFAFIGSALSDFFGRKNLILYPLIIYAAALFVAGLSNNHQMFSTAYIFIAIGAATYAVVAYCLIGDVVVQEHRGTACGVVILMSGIGYFFGPPLGSAIGGIFGLQIPYFVSSLMVVAIVVMLFFVLPQDRDVAA